VTNSSRLTSTSPKIGPLERLFDGRRFHIYLGRLRNDSDAEKGTSSLTQRLEGASHGDPWSLGVNEQVLSLAQLEGEAVYVDSRSSSAQQGDSAGRVDVGPSTAQQAGNGDQEPSSAHQAATGYQGPSSAQQVANGDQETSSAQLTGHHDQRPLSAQQSVEAAHGSHGPPSAVQAASAGHVDEGPSSAQLAGNGDQRPSSAQQLDEAAHGNQVPQAGQQTHEAASGSQGAPDGAGHGGQRPCQQEDRAANGDHALQQAAELDHQEERPLLAEPADDPSYEDLVSQMDGSGYLEDHVPDNLLLELPIDQKRDEILCKIRDHSVVVVNGETGCVPVVSCTTTVR
jgi:hypothetical protein